MRDIQALHCSEEFSRSNFGQCTYLAGNGRHEPMYWMTEEGFSMLVMGFTEKKALEWNEGLVERILNYATFLSMVTLRATLFASLVVLCACSKTVPVAVVMNDGVLRGSTTAALDGGHFEVSRGGLKCAGTYNALSPSVTITIPVLCNDGRRGIVTATREAGGQSGGGRVRMDDGTEGDFIFGEAANRL